MSFIEELNLYANAKIAKGIATIFVAIFVGYHGMLHAMDGGDTCVRLLSDGRFQGSTVWQPYGCMLHSYSNGDARRCMRYRAFLKEDNRIVFVGDSRIRLLYFSFISKISLQPIKTEKSHENLHYDDIQLSLRVEFYWSPTFDDDTVQLIHSFQKLSQPPKLVVIGGATHTIKNYNASEDGYNEYQNSLMVLSKTLHDLGNQTRVLWMLQDPVITERLSASRKAITNDQIDLYNKAAMEIFGSTNVQVWSSSRLVAHGLLHDFEDGLHASSDVMSYDCQILLNLYCNNHLNYNDGTCCNWREAFTATQIVAFAVLCTCSVLMIVVAFKQFICTREPDHVKYFLVGHEPAVNNSNGTGNLTPPSICSKDLLIAFGKLGLILCYFFLCDRTSFFMKENKFYSHLNFWLPVGYVVALGLFFTDDTSYTRIIHKDIANEWKGWMQLMIMVYHMTGASHILPIYMHMRILVSAYLFLMGFQYFNLYWIGHEFGIVMYLQTMFRLNFLAAILCFLMNRPYQFYSYVALVSFWYTVMHITLVMPPRLQRPLHANSEHSPADYVYSIMKLIGLGSFITILYLSEVFFEKIFVVKLWKAIFVTADDDIHEWWFRWKLDRYSMLYGLTFGLLYQAASQYGILDDKSGSNLFTGRLAFLMSVSSTLFVSSYGILTYLFKSKADCDEIHPYLVWLPLLGYIVLRNILGSIRARYSSFFGWFGIISVELFVCHYHIWLAADKQGVLVLIPSYPVANILLTSFICICVAHEIHHITNTLVNFIVPFDTMKTIRNFSIFLMISIAIAIHNGVV